MLKKLGATTLSIAAVVLGGCSLLDSDLTETDFDRILLSYKEKSARVAEEHEANRHALIRTLEVSGSGSTATVSASLEGAERHEVITQILTRAGLVPVYQNVRVGGRITGSWRGLALPAALNRITAGDGVQVVVRGSEAIFKPLEPGTDLSALEFGEHRAQPQATAVIPPSPAPSAPAPEGAPAATAATIPVEMMAEPSDTDWTSREVELDYISTYDAAQVLLAIVPNSGNAPIVPAYVETGSEFQSGTNNYSYNSSSNSTVSSSSYSYSTPTPPESMKAIRFSTVPGKNSLILHGPADQVARATQILRQSDQPGEHILIEALVVEVDTQALERVGSQVSKLQDGRWSDVATSFGDLLGNAITFTNTAGADNSFAFSAIIDLLIADDRARVISRPYITALTGQPATVNISTQQYVVAETSQNGATVTTTQPISAGVVLKIVPFALATGSVRMNVDIEQSEFIPTSDNNVSLSVDRNSATATMQVESGRSVVIGGLMVDSEAKSNSGFPFLRHVPILNYLFAKQSAAQEEREVIVFVTPHLWSPSMKAPLVDPAPLELHRDGPNRRPFFESSGRVPLGLEALELNDPQDAAKPHDATH